MKLADNINHISAVDVLVASSMHHGFGHHGGWGGGGMGSHYANQNSLRDYCDRRNEVFSEERSRLVDDLANCRTEMPEPVHSVDAWDKRRKSIVRNLETGRYAQQLRAQEGILENTLKFAAEGLLSRVERQKAVKCSLDMSSNQPSKEDAQECAIDQLVSNVDLKWYQYALLSMVVVSVLLWKPVLVIVWAVMFTATFLIKEKEVVAYNCLERASELAELSEKLDDKDLRDELDNCNSMLVKLTHKQVSASNQHSIERSIELLIDLIGDYNEKSRDDYLDVTSAFKRTLERQMKEIEFKRKLDVSGKVGILKYINPEY